MIRTKTGERQWKELNPAKETDGRGYKGSDITTDMGERR
jgi:hypothetical protein